MGHYLVIDLERDLENELENELGIGLGIDFDLETCLGIVTIQSSHIYHGPFTISFVRAQQ